ncbi:secretion-regulating guanine nucleotide exchange factor [Papilio machaon]|uniref:secretion-regulating guanine nucleotide exchange factor n=1 Tax=Papilio machaon TaxID=76193 RepID=UPI001E66386E|nr:secretion-regulating guanine nucleotide exchange factor [Papilio machaon]
MADDIPDTGAVFTFGKSRFADNEPSHFFIKNDPVVAISCGDEHSAVICQNGRVFVFGGNAWGQLGLGHREEATRPSCVKWLKPQRAMFVACGRAHTVFVTDTNAIYTVGCNEEGQLGAGDTEPRNVPHLVELESTPAPVRQVSAGSSHTAILTEDGRVFVCGSNSEGQLGVGEGMRSCSRLTELKFMERIAFVECGYYHTVFITEKGAVFVTGDNENQKLGIPNTATTIYSPEVLPLNVPIKSACCGANHTFLLSMDESQILAFGSNEKGQLGMPQEVENVTTPTEIDMEKMFDGYQLKLVACGAMHTAFVTDNGLLYTCGESRHNKLCLEEAEDVNNSNEAVPNQYTPKRVTAMDGYIVDNVSCGGCHTLLTATKSSHDDLLNNGLSTSQEQTQKISLIELPPLQKIPGQKIGDMLPGDVLNSNYNENHTDTVNANNHEEIGSIDSLEANVSGSHIVNINDLDETGSTHGIPDINKDDMHSSSVVKAEIEGTPSPALLEIETKDILRNPDKLIDESKQGIEDVIHNLEKDTVLKMEVVEDIIQKTEAKLNPFHNDEKTTLEIPDKTSEIANSPPPKSPIIQDLLHIPDITQMSPNLSTHSDDGQKSETGQSENETILCASDKSSPQAGKTKTQAVMPIVRSEDHIDSNEDTHNEDVVVENKLEEKGRFARLFQSIREKENSCMGKGKVIEEKVIENVHKGLDTAEEAVHKVEERVETEIRNQTNSRTCNIL